jgi:hypothetical protein
MHLGLYARNLEEVMSENPDIIGRIEPQRFEARFPDNRKLRVPMDPFEAVSIKYPNGQSLEISYRYSYCEYPFRDGFRLRTFAPDGRKLFERRVELPEIGSSVFDLGNGFAMSYKKGVGWSIRPLVSITDETIQVEDRSVNELKKAS